MSARDALSKIPIRVVRRPDERRPWGTPISEWAKHRRNSFALLALASKDGIPEGANAKVPCNGCTACCRSGLEITLENIESGDGLNTFNVGGVRMLRKNSDGSCVHLVDNRCSVYAQRPMACRTYDCRDLAISSSSHSGQHSKPVNDAIMSWEPEAPAKEDADTWMIISILSIALRLKGKDRAEAFLIALRDYPTFLSEADGIRAWAMQALAGSPQAQALDALMRDPSITQADIEAAALS